MEWVNGLDRLLEIVSSYINKPHRPARQTTSAIEHPDEEHQGQPGKITEQATGSYLRKSTNLSRRQSYPMTRESLAIG